LDDFDLQIRTPQYVRDHPHNLLELPFPVGNPARFARANPAELEWLSDFPRPRRLMVVGGPARNWELDHRILARTVRRLRRKRPPGSTIIVTSARTRPRTRELLQHLATHPAEVVVDSFPRFATLLAEADELYVT